MTRCPPTRVLKLDKMVKDGISQESVRLDQLLARLQALFLDATGPKASILKEDEKGTLMVEMAVTGARVANIGNMIYQKCPTFWGSIHQEREEHLHCLDKASNHGEPQLFYNHLP